MFYGCVTIGDEAAYNGISGFTTKKHGFICQNNSDFIHTILENLKLDNTEITENAMNLVNALNKDWILNDFTSQLVKKLIENQKDL
jgi:hypothetical protein